MTNKHDEDDLKAAAKYAERRAKSEAEFQALPPMTAIKQAVNAIRAAVRDGPSGSSKFIWDATEKILPKLDELIARSRPEADIEADRLIECRCIDMKSLQECSACIEAEKAKESVRSRPEPDLRYCKHGKLKYERCIPCEPAGEFGVWHEGAPDKCYWSEWFIAKTTSGEKVVLRALPEEFSYDYKTADETYLMRDRIKCWMQFPDSQFIPYSQPRAQTSDGEFERETGDGEESPISAKDQTEIEFHRDQVMEKMVYIHKIENELAELKARMELTDAENENIAGARLAIELLDKCNINASSWQHKYFTMVSNMLAIIERITSSRGNE